MKLGFVTAIFGDLRLEQVLEHPVQANAYFTPRDSQGLAVHHDTHDVFVLQLAGTKAWTIHEPVLADPLPSQPWKGTAADAGPPIVSGGTPWSRIRRRESQPAEIPTQTESARAGTTLAGIFHERRKAIKPVHEFPIGEAQEQTQHDTEMDGEQ